MQALKSSTGNFHASMAVCLDTCSAVTAQNIPQLYVSQTSINNSELDMYRNLNLNLTHFKPSIKFPPPKPPRQARRTNSTVGECDADLYPCEQDQGLDSSKSRTTGSAGWVRRVTGRMWELSPWVLRFALALALILTCVAIVKQQRQVGNTAYCQAIGSFLWSKKGRLLALF